MSQVWELELSHDQRIVLLALADHADDDGYHCYPSVAYTGWKCGYSERSIQRILRKLEQAELIVPLRHTKGGRGKAVEYRVQPWKGVKKPPFKPIENDDNMAPLAKTVTLETQRVTTPVEKGDRATAPQPSVNHHQPLDKRVQPKFRWEDLTPEEQALWQADDPPKRRRR